MEPLRVSTDEEAQVRVGQRGTSLRTNGKAAWLENNVEFTTAIFAAEAALLMPQLSSEYRSIQQHRERFRAFALWTALVVLLIGFLKVFTAGLSGMKEMSHNKKVICSFLTLLTCTAVTSANVAILQTVDNSYLYFAAIPVLQIIFIPWLSYLDLKANQTGRLRSTDSIENETMVKSCFKGASVITIPVCYAMQTALLYSNHSKAIDFSKGAIHYSLEATFLTSAVGCSAMVMASSPLPFRSNCVVFFLRKIPMIMSVLVWLAAAILSTRFLDATAVTFAAIMPITVEIIVGLIWKTWEQQLTAEDTSTSTGSIAVDHSISEAVLPFGTVLIILNFMNFGTDDNSHDRYLITSSVFILLSSVTFGLIRMLFPFHPDCKFAKRLICSMPAIGLLILGFYLILIEIM